MKLLGGSGSPYVRKVRIVLEEKHLAYEHLDVRAASSEVAQANPLGKIPTIVCDDGKSIYDSCVIVDYLDGLVAGPRLIPENFAARIDAKRWEALGDGIIEATVSISHENRLPVAQRKDAAWYAKLQKKIDSGLAAMEQDLGARDFCQGDTFTLADVACGNALAYLDRALPDVEWRKAHPGLDRHLQKLAARDSFKKSQPPKA